MKRINTDGPKIYGCLPYIRPLAADDFHQFSKGPDSLILDTRPVEAFGGAHIPGTIHIALREPFPIWAGEILDEAFPIWAGRILDPQKEICLILPDVRKLDEVQRHLFRIGFEKVAGYLAQGIRTWLEGGYPFASTPQMSVHELHQHVRNDADKFQILDVRSEDEWRQGHIPTAQNIYVPDLFEQMDELDENIPVVTYCGSGYRASIAASILERSGFAVHNIPGSMMAWQSAGYEQAMPAD
jgi:hydroxyacylglutathione hydrolase